MNVRTLSKKTLALLLTLAMLLSCMVWSGVSAAVTTAYQLDFDAYASALESYYHGINAQTYSNATIDVSAAAGGLKKHVRGVHADVLNSGETGHNRVMQMKFYDPTTVGTTVSNPGIEVAGFRITETGASVSVPSGKTYVVIFDYKVIDVTVPVDLLISVGSSHWGTERPHDNDKKGSSFSLAPGCETGVWKKGVTILNLPSGGQAMHFVMDAGKGYTPAQKAGTEVLIDNIMIYNSLANGQAAGLCQFTVNYNDTTVADQSINGVIGQTYTPPTPTRTGYTFTGWYTDANCTVPYTGTITAGLTGLYAGWEASDNTAYIDFDCGDVPVSVATLAGDAGTTVALPDGPVVSDGSYKFLRWEDAQGQPVTEYTFPAKGERVTITAVWTPLVRHEFYYNDGTTTYVLHGVYVIDNMTFPTVPVKNSAYAFAGWNTAADGTGETVTTDTIGGTEPRKLYAQWTYTYVEEHETDAHKAFYTKYADNMGEGYAQAPSGSRGGVMAGNGSGVILSYQHNYDVATGADLPGSAAGGFSTAIHLSGNNYHTKPKHILTVGGNKVRVTRGNGYTVKFMVYVDEDMSLPFTLGTVPTSNTDFNIVGQLSYYEEMGANGTHTVDVKGGQWQEVTLEVPAVKAAGQLTIFADNDFYLYMGLLDHTSKKYVYIDHVTVYEHKAIETTTMNFEDMKVGQSLNLAGECSAVVSADQNTTDGGSQSLRVNSHHGGATRAQFLVLDGAGKPIVVEEGASYRITLRVLVPDHVNNYSTNAWFAAAGATQKFSNGTDKSKYTLRADTATTGVTNYEFAADDLGRPAEYKSWLVTGSYVWKTYTFHLNNVTLTEQSKATDRYLRFGIGHGNATEKVYYLDDILVQKIEATPTLSQNAMGFENLAAGTNMDVRNHSGHKAVVSTDYSRTGNNSVKITSDVIQSGNIRAQMVLRDEQGNPIRLKPGQKYTMSYYVRFTDTGWNPGLFTWLACSTDGKGIDDSSVKDANKLYEYNYVPYDFEAGYEVGEVPQTMYHTWQKVSYTFTASNANLTENSYLIFGISHLPRRGNQVPGTGAGAYEKPVSFYLDDLTVTPFAMSIASIDKVLRGYQYVGGGEQDSSAIEGTPGSAIYVQDGVEKTAFRVGATYNCGSSFDTVSIATGYQKVNNENVLAYQEYKIVERGLLLAKADALGNRELTVDTTKAQGLAGKVQTTKDFDKYWKYNTDTKIVTFTVLVKGVTKAIKDTKFVARSYVKAMVDGREYYVYGEVSNPFSSQSIYNATDKTATWFTEEAAQ